MMGVEIYEDLIDYVLYRFQLNNLKYKVLLLSDQEFDVFNYECDVVKSFYYMISIDDDSDNGKIHDKYYEMVTKEYGEFFYQSGDDSYVSAALVHIKKVYNTVAPVYNAIEILNKNNGTDKDVTFLHTILKENSDHEYMLLLREQRHHELLKDDLEDVNIFFDVIHEAIHMVEHEKPPSWWKFWRSKRKKSEEMDVLTNQLYNEWVFDCKNRRILL
jgi:hypothetical protein